MVTCQANLHLVPIIFTDGVIQNRNVSLSVVFFIYRIVSVLHPLDSPKTQKAFGGIDENTPLLSVANTLKRESVILIRTDAAY